VAKIQLGNGAPPLYCVVTDISDGGVRVHANGFYVPDEFVLLIAGDGPFQNGTYRVIWRRDDEVGAKLVRVA
jgi:PilZ domain-containing protein